VAGYAIEHASGEGSYSGTLPGRLCRAVLRRLSYCALAVVLSLTAAGCSFSYQLGSLFEKSDDKSDQTGSIAPVTTGAAVSEAPGEGDLAYARAAVAEVLTRGGKDASAPWSNPRTGARGTVTPIATAYNQDGFVCRDFLASYVREGSEAWLQGEACRIHQGKWEVRRMRPWKRS
jgi:surface antigen